MATSRQKEAARENIKKAREARSARAHGQNVPRQGEGMSTQEKDELNASEFAFPKERKEPLTDARHVRNAIARFDQVEGVTDREREQAWKRILAAPSASASRCPRRAGETWPREARTAAPGASAAGPGGGVSAGVRHTAGCDDRRRA